MWDSAGILNSRGLLDNLGFRSKEVRISQLSLAIDEDLQGMTDQEDVTAQPLLRASLALHKAEVNALQLAFRQLATQNRKLHTNNRDINRRAALLAQEVDERHNHLESTARTEVILRPTYSLVIQSIIEINPKGHYFTDLKSYIYIQIIYIDPFLH